MAANPLRRSCPRPGRSRRARARVALPVLALVAALPAQGGDAAAEAAFVAAYARFAAAGDAGPPALAVAASDCFLALGDEAARGRHLAAGVQATLVAGRNDLALVLAEGGLASGGGDPQLRRFRLQALARAGRFAAFVDQARADLVVAAAAVHAALAAEEARLGPAAAAALRAGDASRARFVFEQLAALLPAQPWRAGNLGLCLRQLGELAAARAVYADAVQRWPDDLELWNDFGLCLRAAGDLPAAIGAFARSHALDLARGEDQRGRGPAITNLLHLAVTRPGLLDPDPLPDAGRALALRPDAAMLRRLVLDAALDRVHPVVGAVDRR